jgi:hypothetical protein
LEYVLPGSSSSTRASANSSRLTPILLLAIVAFHCAPLAEACGDVSTVRVRRE